MWNVLNVFSRVILFFFFLLFFLPSSSFFLSVFWCWFEIYPSRARIALLCFFYLPVAPCGVGGLCMSGYEAKKKRKKKKGEETDIFSRVIGGEKHWLMFVEVLF